MGERELEVKEEKTAERFANRSENFFKAYEAWEQEQLCSEKRDVLRKALHSMRKVLARVEIEMALSESKERAKNPMPIPTHRTKNKKDGTPLEISDDVKKRIKARKKAEAEEGNDEGDDLPNFLTQEGEGDDKGKSKKPRSSQRRPRNGGGGGSRKKKSDD